MVGRTTPTPLRRPLWGGPARFAVACAALLGALLPGGGASGAPPKPVVVAVLGSAADGRRLAAATSGARFAAATAPADGPLAGGVQVESVNDGGTAAGLKKALGRVRKLRPVAVVAVVSEDLHEAYWRAARSLRVPWVSVSGVAPDSARNPGNILHLGPTQVGQGVAAADAVMAPLGARRVGVVHEPTAFGRDLAAAFARNLSERVTLAGVRAFGEEAGPAALRSLEALEAEWLYVAMNGRHAHRFVEILAGTDWRPRLFFADGARDESLLARGPQALEGCVFLDGPDPEMQGRRGEALIDRMERDDEPVDVVTVRSYEGARLILAAIARAGSTRLKQVWAALEPGKPAPGTLGTLSFEHHGSVRMFPFTFWRVRKGRFAPWPEGLLPTPGCGPPIGFGRPAPARLNPKGRLGVVTYGTGEKRTIEADLLAIGLSTDGRSPDLDEIVRAEVLGRAIRIAHRLFRREPDGTPIPGWSWGMTFTTKPPGDEVKGSRRWLAVVAGDHEAAGGQAFGTWVAVYSTFLRRTMYASRKLDPPLSEADRVLLDGTYRWGEDRSLNFRADKIRCLMDGYASAMGLTLSHEFGHLCGCGHDTEHPTSIMNVVAGAGASWEDAVWIPRHQRHVTTSLGIEGVEK